MYQQKQFYCLTPQWQQYMAEALGGELKKEKFIIFPEKLGKGQSYFVQVIPGIAVLLMDFVLSAPLSINRVKDDTPRYIFHFDLSDQTNFIKIHNMQYKVGYTLNLGLSMLNNQDNSYFEPAVGQRTFALRLFIDKKLLNEFLNNNAGRLYINQKINFSRKNFFFCDHLDGDSLLLLLSLKDTSPFETSFDSNIKGITLKLLANLFERYGKPIVPEKGIKKTENIGLIATKKYLLDHLHQPFPTIKFLSDMAGMSTTKFKILFKKRFQKTSNHIFTEEKMALAQKLLQSGDFTTLNEIVEELNYSKLDHFSAKYFTFFKKKPSQDFIKKNKL